MCACVRVRVLVGVNVCVYKRPIKSIKANFESNVGNYLLLCLYYMPLKKLICFENNGNAYIF